MKRLIIHGDPGIRKEAIIEVGDEEYVCFSVTRQGDYHGPGRVQLWCTVGSEDERETFDRRDFIPMHLEVESVDADAVSVTKRAGDPSASFVDGVAGVAVPCPRPVPGQPPYR